MPRFHARVWPGLMLIAGCMALTSLHRAAAQDAATPIVAADAGEVRRFDPAPLELRLWASTEYFLWWLSPGNAPPLVTTGNPLDRFPGAFGQPGTRVLYDGAGPAGPFNGLRVNIGGWFNNDWGAEVSGFSTETRANHFTASSNDAGNPPIYLPLYRINPIVAANREGSYTISDPLFVIPGFGPTGAVRGRIEISSATQFWGAEVNALRKIQSGAGFSSHWLAGYRYLNLDDRLSLAGFGDNAGALTPRFRQDFSADFLTHNQFHGGQFGAMASWNRNRFSFDLLGKVALGATHEIVSVQGRSIENGAGVRNPPGPNTYINQASPYVMPSNVGQRSNDAFAVVPQVQIKMGCRLTDHLRATAAYDFLYWSNVARAGEQLDRRINDSQATTFTGLSGPAFPASVFSETSFIAHGVTFGLELRY